MRDLNPQKALIFRIVHRDNMPWMITHGLHCQNSGVTDPKYVALGNQELISKRTNRAVPCPTNGMLSDYVPFYFTPFSPMLYNIKTGYAGITRRPNAEIVMVVSSLPYLLKLNIPFVFTDRHAYLKTALFFTDLARLDQIRWKTLQERDFKKDDIDKFERYQAEALVHNHLPVNGLLGIACYNDTVAKSVNTELVKQGLSLTVAVKPAWYF